MNLRSFGYRQYVEFRAIGTVHTAEIKCVQENDRAGRQQPSAHVHRDNDEQRLHDALHHRRVWIAPFSSMHIFIAFFGWWHV